MPYDPIYELLTQIKELSHSAIDAQTALAKIAQLADEGIKLSCEQFDNDLHG